jgi:hypothetical protein
MQTGMNDSKNTDHARRNTPDECPGRNVFRDDCARTDDGVTPMLTGPIMIAPPPM